jgi:hypothetical protein
MEITKKQIFSFIFLFVAMLSLASFVAVPVQADSTLAEGQEGLNDVSRVF